MLYNTQTHQFESRLGLEQSRSTAGPSRVRSAPVAPPKRDGILWDSVTVLADHGTSPQLQCNNCNKKFCGGATHIRDHICDKCECESDAFMAFKLKALEMRAESREARDEEADPAGHQGQHDGGHGRRRRPTLASA